MELFEKGGPVMYLLLLSSIVVLAIALERFFLYRRATKNFLAFLSDLPLLLQKPLGEAMSICQKEKNMAAFLTFHALEAREKKRDIRSAVDASYTDMAMLLRARLNYLSMIVTMAPLLGLLGTIFGMIDAFNVFSLQAGQPLAITGGIGEALIATATGLCVAIFALIVHTYFAQKLDEALSGLDKTVTVLLNELETSACKEGNSHAP